MNGGEQIYCCNENVMMHVLENCSDIIGFKYYKIFKHYSLNVIKKIIEETHKNLPIIFLNMILTSITQIVKSVTIK